MSADTEWVWDGTETGMVPDPFMDSPDPLCRERSPAGMACTRTKGHPGRHVAGGINCAVSAWPGTHPPTADDAGDPS